MKSLNEGESKRTTRVSFGNDLRPDVTEYSEHSTLLTRVKNERHKYETVMVDGFSVGTQTTIKHFDCVITRKLRCYAEHFANEKK